MHFPFIVTAFLMPRIARILMTSGSLLQRSVRRRSEYSYIDKQFHPAVSFSDHQVPIRPTKDDSQPRKPNYNDANKAQPEPPPSAQGKRPLSSPAPRSLSGIGALNLDEPRGSQDAEQPQKRAAIGIGISARSTSPYRGFSEGPPPRRSRARLTSVLHDSDLDTEERRRIQWPNIGGKQIWTEDAAIQAQPQTLQRRRRKSFPSYQQTPRNPRTAQSSPRPVFLKLDYAIIYPNAPARDDNYDIIMQPETRPISQEQLAAESMDIEAGLLMIEAERAKEENREMAQLALRPTLHHQLFMASQHPSASPVLRRLGSKYAIPSHPRYLRHKPSPLNGNLMELEPPGDSCSLLPNPPPVASNPEELHSPRYLWSPVCRMLTRNKKLCTCVAFWRQFGFVVGASTEPSPTVPQSVLCDTVMAVVLGAALTGAIHFDRWQDSDLLGIIKAIMPLACLYLGRDLTFTERQLLVTCLFTAISNIVWIKQRLIQFPRTGALTVLTIPTLGIMLACAAAYCLPDMSGRYADKFILAAVGSLLTTMILSRYWEAAFLNMGRAHRFELGAYDERISNFTRSVFDTWIHQALARLFEAGLQWGLNRLFGPQAVDAGVNRLRETVRDIESDLGRPFDGDEAFRGAGNPYQQERQYYMRRGDTSPEAY